MLQKVWWGWRYGGLSASVDAVRRSSSVHGRGREVWQQGLCDLCQQGRPLNLGTGRAGGGCGGGGAVLQPGASTGPPRMLGGSDEIKHVKNKKPTLVSYIFTKCF